MAHAPTNLNAQNVNPTELVDTTAASSVPTGEASATAQSLSSLGARNYTIEYDPNDFTRVDTGAGSVDILSVDNALGGKETQQRQYATGIAMSASFRDLSNGGQSSAPRSSASPQSVSDSGSGTQDVNHGRMRQHARTRV